MVYSVTMWTVHAISLITFSIWYNGSKKEKNNKQMLIKKWMENNKGMTAGLFTTAVTAGVIEGCARLASNIILTEHIQSSAHALWIPEVFNMLNTLLLILCHVICGCYNKWDKCCKGSTTPFSTLHHSQHYTSFFLYICLHLDCSTSCFQPLYLHWYTRHK